MADASHPHLDTGRAGIILAGGRSTRFGGIDKATATVGGQPMIHRVAASLDPVVDELVVNCRAEQRDSLAGALLDFDIRFAEDSHPDRGPVFGLRTALRATSVEYAAVLPCDSRSSRAGSSRTSSAACRAAPASSRGSPRRPNRSPRSFTAAPPKSPAPTLSATATSASRP
ncbi:molybdopterin-guanine dinucleotide biosynthesis protein A [Haloferax volcanii DS2]|uniref:Molybdopterin-guanine dinucleotide biosynthesis protein A n=1 Tax=Haloferax volcanii (strain ATCC 29605 / DSM 3757 / JCM 8879 / NBRC 14742 / NCIMB 2012 / VKM B-1768 / DS2) TaxID=309800 RepID=L9VCS9_HALVD|nr:molybdopterin-guanine dinucleotide biosynthesis protein A [Haloferax volcanii DS2]